MTPAQILREYRWLLSEYHAGNALSKAELWRRLQALPMPETPREAEADKTLDTCDRCGRPTVDLSLIQRHGYDFVCAACREALRFHDPLAEVDATAGRERASEPDARCA